MGIELADIFRRYGNSYRQKYSLRMPSTHLKAMRDIEQCRTEALGGQIYRCPDCEQVQYSHHSCRNRHCPKCQNENAQDWLEKQQDLLLPMPYFLLTFTSLRSSMRWLAVTKACSMIYSSKHQLQQRNNLPRIPALSVA